MPLTWRFGTIRNGLTREGKIVSIRKQSQEIAIYE